MTSPTSPLLAFPHLHLPYAAAPEELAPLRDWLRAVRATAHTAPAPRPFLIVTPLGRPLRHLITRWLDEHHIPIARRIPIPNWARASTAVYAKTDDDERLRVALGFETLWQSISLSLEAERWEVAEVEAFLRLTTKKAALRAGLGTLRFHLHLPDVTLRTPNQMVRLQAVHVPDPATWMDESRWLDHILEPTQ